MCRDLEYDRCTAERVIVDESALQKPGTGGGPWTSEELLANCILRETGAVESCKVEGAPESTAGIVASFLERRRYRPVLYRGKSVPVAYEYKVSLSLVPSESRNAFRRAAFEFLVDETIRQQGDGGVRKLCLGLGKDEQPAEAAQIHRTGWSILPIAQCEDGFPYVYAHLVGFQVLEGRGDAHARVGLAYSGGEGLTLRIEQADAGWQFRIDARSQYEH